MNACHYMERCAGFEVTMSVFEYDILGDPFYQMLICD